MALVKCPECEREISDKAMSCPGCGYVVRQAEEKQYVLSVPTKAYASSYGNVLRFCAWCVWILGGIYAILMSLKMNSYGVANGFDFITFMVTGVAVVLGGIAIKCFAEFFDDVCIIRQTLQGMRLVVKDERKTTLSSASTGSSYTGSVSDFWRCKSCGEKVTKTSISCPYCGTYR